MKNNVKWTDEQWSKYVNDITNNEYTSVGKYNGNNEKTKIKHNKCNNIFEMRPANFKLGNRCPYCAGVKKLNIDIIKKKVYDIVGDEYEVLSKEYINNKTPILFHHTLCNHDFKMTSKDFLKNNGNRCPKCKRSKGELEIEKYLKKYNLSFETNVRNTGCKNKRNLEFDFKIIKDNLIYFIEFDGKFHYEPFKNNEKEINHLNNQKINDKIKDEFCRKNNFKLIRIYYKDFNNIENILIENLNIDKVN
jgi:uncharacterized protein with PIN domain